MSVFRPFRNKPALVATMVVSGALKFGPLVPALAAQQPQNVNVTQIGSVAVAPALCDNSTGLLLAATDTNVAGNSRRFFEGSTATAYICGWDVSVGNSTQTLQWVWGNSTDCATSETQIDMFYRLSSATGFVRSNAGYPQFIVPSSFSLCLEAGSTGAYGAWITYVTR